eukprot:3872054-Rhodomonas_salina.1
MQTSGERSCAESAAKNFSRCNVVCPPHNAPDLSTLQRTETLKIAQHGIRQARSGRRGCAGR